MCRRDCKFLFKYSHHALTSLYHSGLFSSSRELKKKQLLDVIIERAAAVEREKAERAEREAIAKAEKVAESVERASERAAKRAGRSRSSADCRNGRRRGRVVFSPSRCPCRHVSLPNKLAPPWPIGCDLKQHAQNSLELLVAV